MPRLDHAALESADREPSKSAVIVAVPEAEAVVGDWRRQTIESARLGIPAHVTLLFPFVPPADLDETVEERLSEVLADAAPFDVAFERTARFPELVYLEPEPAEPFAALTSAIAAEWPEHPPYEGAFEVVIPHLTAVESEDEAVLERAAAELEPSLPLEAHVGRASLFVEDEQGRWSERRTLRLGGPG
jgi:2'-5' RNA ligase